MIDQDTKGSGTFEQLSDNEDEMIIGQGSQELEPSDEESLSGAVDSVVMIEPEGDHEAFDFADDLSIFEDLDPICQYELMELRHSRTFQDIADWIDDYEDLPRRANKEAVHKVILDLIQRWGSRLKLDTVSRTTYIKMPRNQGKTKLDSEIDKTQKSRETGKGQTEEPEGNDGDDEESEAGDDYPSVVWSDDTVTTVLLDQIVAASLQSIRRPS